MAGLLDGEKKLKEQVHERDRRTDTHRQTDVYVGGKVRVLEFIRFSYLEHHGSK